MNDPTERENKLRSLTPELLQLVQEDEPDKIRNRLERLKHSDKRYVLNQTTLYSTGELLFHAAARLGDVDVMKVVCPHDAHVATSSENSYTALHYAVANGRRNATRWLLSLTRTPYTIYPLLDVDSMRTADGNTLLHLAVLFRHRDVADMLVKRKASLTALNSEMMTPISYCQSSEMFEILMRSADPTGDSAAGAGLDLYLDFRVTDATGRSVLHYAALYSRDVNLLTNLIYLTPSHDKLFHQAHSLPAAEGTFLHEAARVGNVQFLNAVVNGLDGTTLKKLLRGVFDVSDENISHSPAMVALFYEQKQFFNEIMRLAETEGVDLKVNLHSFVNRLLSDPSIIFTFPEQHDAKTSRALRKMGYDSLLKLFEKVLPTYLALYAGKTELFYLMLESDVVSINQVDEVFNRTCLHWAVIHKRADIVSTLMHLELDRRHNGRRTSVSPKMYDIFGKTAFQIAYEKGDEELVEIMRENPRFRARVQKLTEDREVYVQVLNAILVGAALIAGVSFAGWLQLPSDLFSYTAMRVFYISNSVSFFLALVVMCITIHAMVPTPSKYIGEIRDQMRSSVVIDAILLALSIVAAAIAFGSAGFAALNTAETPDSRNTAKIHGMFRTTVIVMGCLASIPFLSFLFHLYRCTPFREQLLSSLGVPEEYIYREPFLGWIRNRSQKLYKHRSKEQIEKQRTKSLKPSLCNLMDKVGEARADGIKAMKGKHKSLLLFPRPKLAIHNNNNNNNSISISNGGNSVVPSNHP